MFKLTKNNKAFTLIELLVVIAVLGILVLIATPKLFNYTQKAELAKIQHDVKVMEQEMKIALIDSEIEIASWNSNKKNLGALIMQNELFEKEGVAKRIDASHLAKNGILANKDLDNIQLAEMQTEKNLGIGGEYFVALSESDKSSEFTSIDESYKIIPQNYKKSIKTKLNGTFYTNEDGKVYYEHDKPITGDENEDKKLNCPLPLPDYDFEPETGTILKWHGTVTHLIIPEAFKVTVNGKEECVPVRIIGKAAFMQGGFKSIVIPQSVIIIEEDAFKDNELTEIEIPHSVKNVGGNAFVGNNFGSSGGNGGGKGSSVIIKNNPSNITIVPGAFGGSSPIFKPMSPKDLNVIFNPSNGKIVSGNSSSKVISIPESFWVGGVEYPVKEISKGAYQGLGLISVTLPSGLERIEDYAFAGNQLEGIVIPDKVNYIGNYAFAFNEVVHTETGDKKATIEFIKIKNEEQFHKVNQYGDIYENNMKVDKLKGEVELLNHIFVTSIDNHVIDVEYVYDENNSSGESSDENESPSNGIYTQEEINNLLNNDYIEVKTAEDLNNVRNDLGEKYIQTANIDMSDFENFEPIGNDSTKFSGTYDGGGFEISNLTINKPTVDHIGLFGYTSGATIKNVGIENVEITGKGDVGGLVGYNFSSSTVSNSYATGSVTGKGSRVGGLVGYNNSSEIENSYVTGIVSGNDQVGGLVGYNSRSTVKNSYATGSVTGKGSRVGGLVGYNSNTSTVNNSYATGIVSGNGELGGLVGYNNTNSTVSNSYATGAVSGTGSVGGLVGRNRSSKVENSYYDTTSTGQKDSGKGTGKSNAEMKKRGTYSGWNFDSIWQIEEGSYPTLR